MAERIALRTRSPSTDGRGDDRLVARMLRYVERVGLHRAPPDSASGLRLKAQGGAQALRTLRELLTQQSSSIGAGGSSYAATADADLRGGEVEAWFEAEPARSRRDPGARLDCAWERRSTRSLATITEAE